MILDDKLMAQDGRRLLVVWSTQHTPLPFATTVCDAAIVKPSVTINFSWRTTAMFLNNAHHHNSVIRIAKQRFFVIKTH